VSFPICAACGVELGPDFKGCPHIPAPPVPTPAEARAMMPTKADMDNTLFIPGLAGVIDTPAA